MKLTHSLAALVVASVLVVTAGCSMEDPLQAAGAGGGAGSEGSDETATENGDESEADSERDERDTDGDGEVSLKECLIGDWYVDNESFGKLISSTGDGVVDEVTGVVKLTMRADGTSETQYENWKHAITTQGATITILKSGTDFGTYEVHTDGTMSMIDTKISSDTKSIMKIGGQTVTQVVTPEPSVFSQSTFTCTGEELTVTADGGTTILHHEP